MRNFKTLGVWRKGMDVLKHTYALTATLPNSEKFGLISQMNRAAVSIPSNIAEGASRSTQKDFRRFLEIALGSSFELETQLTALRELDFIKNETGKELEHVIDEEQKMLIAFMKKLD
ncbi:four helix bundle protein [Bacteroidota bacterium]